MIDCIYWRHIDRYKLINHNDWPMCAHVYFQYIYNLWVNGGMKKINIKFRCNKYWYHPNTMQLLKCSKLKVFNSTKKIKKKKKKTNLTQSSIRQECARYVAVVQCRKLPISDYKSWEKYWQLFSVLASSHYICQVLHVLIIIMLESPMDWLYS